MNRTVNQRKSIMFNVSIKHSKKEELLNTITHGAAALLGVLGLVMLLIKVSSMSPIHIVSASIFGASLVALYGASALYHGTPDSCRLRPLFQKFDHCAIFLLILGTYTPACLSALNGWLGWTLFGIVAACSVVGIIINCIDIQRFIKASMALYIISGWTIAIASVPYAAAIGWDGFTFLLLGGIAYTVGIIFYKMKTTPYMHTVWHLFVMLGSLMHYIMIYSYVF